MTIEITDANYKDVLDTDLPVMIDFWAGWCGPCKMVAPSVDELATDYEGKAIIAKVDVDNNPEVTAEYGIRSLPTMLFINKGVVEDSYIGAATKKVYSDKIDSLL